MVNIASQRGGTVGIVGVGMRVTALLVLVVATSTGGWAQSRLPQCPGDTKVVWTDCFGTYTFPDGQKYVGEWRDNQRHGRGAETFPDGRKDVGEFRHSKFVGSAVVSNPARPPAATGSNEVQLIKEGGAFTVPVTINGALTLGFTVDSGASDVSIPEDVVTTLIRTGTISESDFLGEQTYRLADGSKVKSMTFRIRQLTVGNRTVNNVLGSVAEVKGGLLLGQSFLSRFGKISFDYGRQVLVLE